MNEAYVVNETNKLELKIGQASWIEVILFLCFIMFADLDDTLHRGIICAEYKGKENVHELLLCTVHVTEYRLE